MVCSTSLGGAEDFHLPSFASESNFKSESIAHRIVIQMIIAHCVRRDTLHKQKAVSEAPSHQASRLRTRITSAASAVLAGPGARSFRAFSAAWPCATASLLVAVTPSAAATCLRTRSTSPGASNFLSMQGRTVPGNCSAAKRTGPVASPCLMSLRTGLPTDAALPSKSEEKE